MDLYLDSISEGLTLDEKLENLRNAAKNEDSFSLYMERDLVGFEDSQYHLIYEAIYGKDDFNKIVKDKRCGQAFNKSIKSLFRSRLLSQSKKELVQVLGDGLRNSFNEFLVFYKGELWIKKNGNLDYVLSGLTTTDVALFIRNIIFLPNIYPLSDREITTLTRSVVEFIEVDDVISENISTFENDEETIELPHNIDGSIGIYLTLNNFTSDNFLDKPTIMCYEDYVSYCDEMGLDPSKITSFNNAIRDTFSLKITRKRKNVVLRRLGLKNFGSDLDTQDRLYVWGGEE